MTERNRLFWLFLAGGVALGGVAVADPFGGVPHTFQADTVISASQMNANFESMRTYINTLEARLDVLESASMAPAGTIVAFGGVYDNIPVGWELCDGRALSRTEPKYAALFAAIGTVHGGDASTFNLPDYRGMFLRGVDRGRGKDPDAAAREAAAPGGHSDGQIGTVQDDALQGHIHRWSMAEGSVGGGDNVRIGKTNNATPISMFGQSDVLSPELGYTIDRPDNHHEFGTVRLSIETRPVNAAVHFIIKL